MKSTKLKKTTARDVFFYLLMIVTLYIGVVSFLTILFQFVNLVIPDPLDYYNNISGNLRGGISALLVVWPVFLFVSWIIHKDIKADKTKLNVWVRRWLLYFTLFIAALTIIIDLITLINGFLGGDLTMRFFLQAASVLIVAGLVFWYFLWSLKQEGVQSNLPKYFAWGASAAGVIVIVAALIATGGPVKQRDIRFDQERVSGLESIQNQIGSYWSQNEELPESLADIRTAFGSYEAPTDPETEESYEYKKTGDLDFELCADFALSTDEAIVQKRRGFFGGEEQTWDHESGRHCFERTINPEYFKDNNVKPVEVLPF